MATKIRSTEPLGFPWKTQDPFLFCVFHEDFFPEGNDQLGPNASLAGRMIGNDFVIKDGWRMYHGDTVPGFPAHPHCGFETVTIVPRGLVDHADSLGATGRFGNGDVQWMTAGKGVQHSEMFPLLKKDEPNPLLLFQIWLNLPRRSKKVAPHYRMLWAEDIPVVKENGAEITLISGEFNGQIALEPAPDSWAADPKNEVAIWTIKMEPGARLTLPKASNEAHRTLFFYQGNTIEIDGKLIKSGNLAELNPSEEIPLLNGDQESHFLFLQGKPINEPVVQHGPFVANYEGEIREAYLEYQQNQFGGWPWSRHDVVHGREKGRFARYADGKEVIK